MEKSLNMKKNRFQQCDYYPDRVAGHPDRMYHTELFYCD